MSTFFIPIDKILRKNQSFLKTPVNNNVLESLLLPKRQIVDLCSTEMRRKMAVCCSNVQILRILVLKSCQKENNDSLWFERCLLFKLKGDGSHRFVSLPFFNSFLFTLDSSLELLWVINNHTLIGDIGNVFGGKRCT